MNLIKHFFSFLIFFSSVIVYSQVIEFTTNKNRIEILEQFDFGNNIEGIDLTVQNKSVKIKGSGINNIFIEQIGSGNNIDTYTTSKNSDLKFFQNGNENYISFITEAKNLEGAIIQEGNNNSSFDFTINPNQDISANLLQQGDNLHFERFGANSIANNLKFIQTGDTKTIIVRNLQ